MRESIANRKAIGQMLFRLGVILVLISYFLPWIIQPSHSARTHIKHEGTDLAGNKAT